MKSLAFAFFALFPYFLWAQSASVDMCAKACLINADCGIGGVCDKGLCRYQNAFCFNERWSVNDRGETTNCDAYACDSQTGLCLRQARTSQDCLSGYVFDGNSLCLPSVQCNLADPACQDLFERWKKARAEYETTTPEPTLPALSCVSCAETTACGSGKMCWKNQCERESAFCTLSENGEHFSEALTRESQSCGNYVCEKVTGQCLTNCLKNSDCRTGKMCVAGSCL